MLTAMPLLSNIPRSYLWIVAAVAFVILASWWVWANYFETYHLVAVTDHVLYRDGFRTLREFETAVGRVQPKVIVSLLDWSENQKEPFTVEQDYCTRARIKYTPIPVKLGGWPKSSEVQHFLTVMKMKSAQPVLVHCAQGVRRTGMMVAAYQMSVLGWDKQKTKGAMLTFGHSQRTVGDVLRFIDVYDPVTMTVPDDLPVGQE